LRGFNLNLNVLAVGVETEEQAHQSGLLICDEMPGFRFGKPVPRDFFEANFFVVSVT
jgi:EAL domain-containing protein (putative c-di-GMP-specific phosphodiesterase class I)